MDKDICCICLDKLNNNIKILPCDHKYHIDCLNLWIRSNPTCPICRASISNCGNEIRQRNIFMEGPRFFTQHSNGDLYRDIEDDLYRDIEFSEPGIIQYYDGLLDSRGGSVIYNGEYDNLNDAVRDFKIYAIFLLFLVYGIYLFLYK